MMISASLNRHRTLVLSGAGRPALRWGVLAAASVAPILQIRTSPQRLVFFVPRTRPVRPACVPPADDLPAVGV